MKTLYFDDLVPGQSFSTSGRTITEADLTFFAMLSGDWHPMHSDAEFAKTTRFGERVVHGTFGIAMATGMMHTLGIFERSVIAMLDLREWRFNAPLRVGDTIRLTLTILDTEPGRSGKNGRVRRGFQLFNQDNTVVQQGESDALVLTRKGANHVS